MVAEWSCWVSRVGCAGAAGDRPHRGGTPSYDPTSLACPQALARPGAARASRDRGRPGARRHQRQRRGGSWQLAYTLTSGLNLGTPYQVPGYPTGDNAATGLPWAPATDGLRNITGRVSPDGTVTIWAVTSTVSGGGDQGADPNKVVAITDRLGAQTVPAGESFRTLEAARSGQVLRGVSFTPGTVG